LWTHFIDPHGRYVAHPDVVDYGSSEPDLYDAEIKWTDQEVGRLLRELERIPGGDRTIVVLTSDHGDSMGEHNIPVGTHATGLYHELIHVPLIFYIPNNMARSVGGAVTNLDVLPTIAELAGIDVSDLSFEGRSLVPQIFYGKKDMERIVFAETNIPMPHRAAVSGTHKFIYYMHSNVSELYDIQKDPGEKNNLVASAPPELAHYKDAMNAWLERVVYSRDPAFNQAAYKMADVLLKQRPMPSLPLANVTLADNALKVLGYGLATGTELVPGAKVDVWVYLEVMQPLSQSIRFGVTLWPTGTVAAQIDSANTVRVGTRPPVGGMFPTDRWHVGEFIRERFAITVPATWNAKTAQVALTFNDVAGKLLTAAGTMAVGEPNTLVLGPVNIQGS
jgi:Sulfatase